MTQRSRNLKLKIKYGFKLAGAYAGARNVIQDALIPQPQPDLVGGAPDPYQVPYTPNGAIAAIDPATVTWDDAGGVFLVPVTVETFTFTDDAVAMSCTWNEGTEQWDFAIVT